MKLDPQKLDQAVNLMLEQGYEAEALTKELGGLSEQDLAIFSDDIIKQFGGEEVRAEAQAKQERQALETTAGPGFETGGAVGAIQAGIRSVTDVLTLGQDEKIMAGVEAGVRTIGEKLGLVKDDGKDLVATFDESLDKFEAQSKLLEQDQVAASVVGDFAGYMLNPLARGTRGLSLVNRAMKSGKLLSLGLGAAADVAVVKGGEAVLNTIWDTAIEGGDFAEVAKEQALAAAGEVGAAALGGAVIGRAAGGAKVIASDVADAVKFVPRKAIKLWGRAARALGGDEQADIIRKATELSKMGVKDKASAREAIRDIATDAVNLAKTAAEEMASEFKGAEAKNTQLANDLLKSATDELKLMTAKIADSVNAGDPGKLTEAFTSMVRKFQVSKWDASTAFGDALQDTFEKAQGTTVKAGPIKSAVLKALADDGSIVIRPDGEVLMDKVTRSQYPQAAELVDMLKSKTELGFKELHGLLMATNVGFTGGDASSRDAWKLIRNTMADPDIWGDDVAIRFDDLQKQYDLARAPLKSLQLAMKKLQLTGRRLEAGASFTDEMNNAVKDLKRAEMSVDSIGSLSDLSSTLKPDQVAEFKSANEAISKFYDMSKATSVKKLQTTMKKYYSGTKLVEGTEKEIFDAIDTYKLGDEVSAAVDRVQRYSKVAKALKNPFDKSAVSAAKKWVEQNADEIGPEISALINKSAKWHRLAGVKKPGKAAIDALRQTLGDVEADTFNFARQTSKEIQDLLENEKLVKTFLKVDPGLFKAFGLDSNSTIFTGRNALLAAWSTVDGGLFAGAYGVFKLLKNPSAFWRLAQEAGVDLSEAQVRRMSRTAQVASKAIASWYDKRGSDVARNPK